MNFKSLLDTLKQQNIRLSLENGKLQVKAQSALAPDLLAALKQHKPALMDWIVSRQGVDAADFPYARLSPEALTQIQKEQGQVQDIYIATPMQQGMLFHGMTGEQSGAYISQLCFKLSGTLDLTAFEQAWQAVISRHDILRTAFVGLGDKHIHQLVKKQVKLPLVTLDLRALDSDLQQSTVARHIENDSHTGFDFSVAPLMRLTVLRLAASEYQVIWSHHHSILDGWCIPIVFAEVMESYRALAAGGKPVMAPVVPYQSYIAWLFGQDQKQGLAYWQQYLADFSGSREIVEVTARPAAPEQQGYAEIPAVLDDAVSARLDALAKTAKCTMNVLVQAVWAMVTRYLTGADDMLFGTVVSGRPAHLHGVEKMVGMFINTLPMRARITAKSSVGELLGDLNDANLEHEQHAYLALNDIHKNCPGIDSQNLFETLVVFENYPSQDEVAEQSADSPAALSLGEIEADEKTNFALSLKAYAKQSLHLVLGYQREMFEPAFIEQLGALVRQGFEALSLSALDTPIDSIALIGSQANQALLAIGDNLNEPSGQTLCALFAEQVRQTPDAIALEHNGKALSYAEFDQRANALAHVLAGRGVKAGARVALCLPRSIDWLVAMMAVLKCGAAYVPLALDGAEQRRDDIITQSGASLVICDKPQSFSAEVLDLSAPQSLAALEKANGLAIDGRSDPDAIAYVLFTSGSTGKPKGVAVPHRALVNLRNNFGPQKPIEGMLKGRWGWLAATTFDASLQGIVQLTHGGTVVIIDDELKKDPDALFEALSAQPLDVMDCTPTIVAPWLGHRVSALLPHLVIGGEAISGELWQQLVDWQQQSGRQAINVYGPTENCVNSTWALIAGATPLIGRPVEGVGCYVLSAQQKAVPVGVAGELYLSGNSLAAGYLGQPQLTDERFVELSLGRQKTRVYRSGDIVRWSADGQLVFLRRDDDQVKVRGYRIELGEIEQQLAACDGVAAATVLAAKEASGATTLGAYVQFDNDGDLDGLRLALSRRVPDYMVPSRWYQVDKMPLNSSGKVDRKALAQLPLTHNAEQYQAPVGALQQSLCELWQQVLGKSPIGINDNFFSHGGDSIVSIQLVSRARALGLYFSVRDLFEHPTIATLAPMVAKDEKIKAYQGEVRGKAELLPVQRAFFARQLPDAHHFNQSLLLNAPAAVDSAWVQSAAQALWRTHDALRLTFDIEGDKVCGRYLGGDECLDKLVSELQVVGEDQAAQIEHACSRLQQQFELSRGPLFKLLLVSTEQGEKRLFLLAHHLVVDAVSWRVMVAQLEQAWQQHTDGKAIDLGLKTSSYQQWAESLAELADSELMAEQVDYWREQLAPSLDLLPQEKTAAAKAMPSDGVGFELEKPLTDTLLNRCNDTYRVETPELILAALMIAWQQWCGQSVLPVSLESHGRDETLADVDLSSTVGWFTAIAPLTLQVNSSDSVATIVKSVKDQYRRMPQKGIGYGVLAHLSDADAIVPTSDERRILFNYLGQLDNSVNREDGVFTLAEEATGSGQSAEQRPQTMMTLNAMVTGGRLRVALGFDPARLDKTSVAELQAYFEQALKQVVTLCSQGDTGGSRYSLADFPLASMPLAELEGLERRFGGFADLYPATPMQQGMLFHSLLEQAQSGYVSHNQFMLEGVLDIPAFSQSWQQICARHAIFRTAFVGLDSAHMHQLVVDKVELPLTLLDWRGQSAEAQQQSLAQLKAEDKARGFDFAAPPLMRLYVIVQDDNHTQVLWSHHHVLLDGWCMPIVMQEVMQSYHARVQGRNVKFTEVSAYRDYIEWLGRRRSVQSLAYWQQQLGSIYRATPIDAFEQSGESAGYRELDLSLSLEASRALSAQAKRHGCTLNAIIQGLWGYCLSRYGNEQTVVFGTTVSGRPAELAGVESMVGLFINTIPVVVDTARERSLADYFTGVQQDNLARIEHGYLALLEIQKCSKVAAGKPLFDTLVVYENYPVAQAAAEQSEQAQARLALTGMSTDEQSHYGVTLRAYFTDALHLNLGFGGTFSASKMQALGEQLSNLLEQVGRMDWSGKLTDLTLLTDTQQAELAASLRWGQTAVSLSADTLQQRFEQAAAQYPERVAISLENAQLSYAELNARANQLAHHLMAQGVGKGALVGIALDPCLDMPVAILAVLKAGAAYVPMDPASPSERLSFIVADASVSLVLCHRVHGGLFQSAAAPLLLLDEQATERALAALSEANPGAQSGGEDTAYVIYTSGSTGQPKGVLMAHQSVARLFDSAEAHFDFGCDDVWTLFHSFAFDFSVWELWGALHFGGKLVIVPKAVARSAEQMVALMAEHKVSVLNQTPSAFYALMPFIRAEAQTLALRYVVFGGEALGYDKIAPWFDDARYTATELVNMYGITETCVHVTYQSVNPLFAADSSSDKANSIGLPLAHLEAAICDVGGDLQAKGVAGELLIAGGSLALGYLGRETLTAERFVARTMPGNALARWYRTGDLAALNQDGTLNYLGRIDEQVKIRGYRIELGEIEAQLKQHPTVQSCAVLISKDDQPRRLIAYVVASGDSQSLIAQLQSHLAAFLPDYMVPKSFVFIEQLPLTNNGKLDKDALYALDGESALQSAYQPPRNEVERQLCELWQQLLKKPSVGIDDNFFALGGDSIVSIQLASRAKAMGLAISVKQLFEHQTIAELASVVGSGVTVTAEQGPCVGEMPLLPIQHWFFERKLPEAHHFNQSLLLTVEGSPERQTLCAIAKVLVARHDALRLTFDGNTGRFTALDDEWTEQAVSVIDIDAPDAEHSAEAVSRVCERLQGQFNLAQGPLFKLCLMRLPGAQSRLFIVAHHLVVDGVSWRILMDDLTRLLAQHQSAQTLQLGEKTSSYALWAERLIQYGHSDALKNQRDHWQAQASGSNEALAGLAQPAKSGCAPQVQSVHLTLAVEDTEALLGPCNQVFHSRTNELLLTALLAAYQRRFGADGVQVMLEGHGREALFDDISLTDTVGWFTALYPLYLQSTAAGSLLDSLKQVKQQYRTIPDNGIGYGVLNYLLGETLSVDESAIVFNYLGLFDNVVNKDGPVAAAEESTGPDQSKAQPLSALLTVNALVSGSQLRFHCIFDGDRLEKDAVAALMNELESALVELCRLAKTSAGKPLNMLTPLDFPNASIDLPALDELQEQYGDIERLYITTPLQQGMLFHAMEDGTGASYTTQTTLDLNGDLNLDAFKAAWQQVLDSHDILRTCFVNLSGEPHQLVLPKVELPWQLLDISALTEDEQQRELDTFRHNDKARGFDFASAPLLRLSCIRLSDHCHHIIWSHHHMLLDGWCLPLLFEQVMRVYHGLCDGTPVTLDTPKPFEHYIQWLNKRDIAAAEQFWHRHLAGFGATTPLMVDQLPGNHNAPGTGETMMRLSKADSDALQRCAREHQCTVNVLVQAAWAYCLYRYSGERDVVFGATISGRPADLDGVEQMLGLFINSIPVRVQLDLAAPLGDLLKGIHKDNIARDEQGFVSLSNIHRQSEVPMQAALFESLIVFENYPVAEQIERSDGGNQALTLDNVASFEQSNYPLAVIAHLSDTLGLKLNYRRERISDDIAEQVLAQLCHVVTAMAHWDGSASVGELPLLTPSIEANDSTDVPQWCVHQQFAEQALAAPESIALKTVDGEVSYGQLQRLSDKLAAKLVAKGLCKGQLCGIYLGNGADTLIAILAVLKAGGAYVPLDPGYPAERIEYMLRDGAIELVLTEAELGSRDCLQGVETLVVSQSLAEDETVEFTPVAVNGDDLAYVIYTSGSTGQPKGVCVEHRGMANLAACEQRLFDIGHRDTVLQFASISFDACVWEWISALSNGAALAILPAEYRYDWAALCDFIGRKEVTVATLPPALLTGQTEPVCPGVKALSLAGEVLSKEAALKAQSLFPNAAVFNAFGATENTVCATVYRFDGSFEGREIPVGRAIDNMATVVCNDQGQPNPLGVPGELYLSGVGLARGYLARPALSAERFVDIDFDGNGLRRYYKTGDIARVLPGGDIQILGRADNQVKVRGFRIELGEIESCLKALTGVADAVVNVEREGPGQASIVAYVVPANIPDQPQAQSRMLGELSAMLPEYMVPAAVIFIESIPLTTNGKVDLNALPRPDKAGLNDHFVAPRDELERRLCALWQAQLGGEQVGIYDNFFTLGGDSIVAIQLVARARREGLAFSVKQLFAHPTVAALAPHTENAQTIDAIQEAVTGTMPLMPVQHDFFAQNMVAAHHYNHAVMLETPAQMNEAHYREAIALLLARHDALRLTFSQDPQGRWQAVHQPLEAQWLNAALNVFDGEQMSELEAVCERLQRSFELPSTKPMFTTAFFAASGQGKGRLFLCLHHLLVDGVSWRVLLKDLETALSALVAGRTAVLGDKTSAYQQWSEALQQWRQSDAFIAQKAYWQSMSEPLPGVLPGVRSHNEGLTPTINTLAVRVCASTTETLLGEANDAYHTKTDELLLAALLLAFRQWSGHSAMRLNVESHGREALFERLDVSETCGWFTALYPLRLSVAAEVETGEVIRQVKEQVRSVPNGGIGFGLAVQHQDIEVSDNRHDGILFNYLGQFDNTFEQDGLLASAAESVGQSFDPRQAMNDLLAINARVSDGVLGAGFAFDASRIEPKAVQDLAADFEQALSDVAMHCLMISNFAALGGHGTTVDNETENDDEGLLI